MWEFPCSYFARKLMKVLINVKRVDKCPAASFLKRENTTVVEFADFWGVSDSWFQTTNIMPLNLMLERDGNNWWRRSELVPLCKTTMTSVQLGCWLTAYGLQLLYCLQYSLWEQELNYCLVKPLKYWCLCYCKTVETVLICTNMFEGWRLGYQPGSKSSGSHTNVIIT